MATKATPAQRARARRDPAIFAPPPRVRGSRFSSITNLHLRANGVAYSIGENVEGDHPWSEGMDQTGQVTLTIRDQSDSILDVLTDESLLLADGVTVLVDGVVYVVQGVEYDGEGLYSLTLEDEVSWRLKKFTSYRTASRARTTRYGFIQSFVDEASRKPFPPMRSWIPEVDDKQPIAKAKRETVA
jgi:hypothetical protein